MATHSSILAWRITMDRGAWRVTVHGVTKSQTRLSTAQQQGKASEFAFPTSSGWCCCFSGIAVRTSAPQCGTQRLLGYFCSPVSCDGSSASSGGPSSLWADLPYMEFVTPTLAGSQNPWQVQILEVRIISYLRLPGSRPSALETKLR